MTEEYLEESFKGGHHFEFGPYLLDLYRLLSMILADRRLAVI